MPTGFGSYGVSYSTEMNRMQNEYLALIEQIRDLREENGSPTKKEAVLYQKAASICAVAVSKTTGAAQEKWRERYEGAETELKKIARALNPQGYARRFQENSGGEGDGNTSAGSGAGAAANAGVPESVYNESVTPEMVDKWFQGDPGFGYEKVDGMDDVKARLDECARDLSERAVDDYLEMDFVNSYLFYGLPGCGKTHIIKAFAHELIQSKRRDAAPGEKDWKYLSVDGGNILSKFVGDSEKIIKALFEVALAVAPCIVFVDEMDGVCPSRRGEGIPAYAYNMTEAFLTGFSSIVDSGKDIIFLGATNHPERVDVAMLDRMGMINIPLPDDAARTARFGKALKMLQLEPGFTFEEMAEETLSYNYRDIERLVKAVKKLVKAELKERMTPAEAVQAMRGGAFNLTRELFLRAKNSIGVTPKADSQRQLDEWSRRVMEHGDE